MALRAWAVAHIKAGEPPRVLRDMILSTGAGLAFVSLAVSVLVDRIDEVADELDPFLVHPLIWRLEGARANQERGLALEIPEATRLTWTLSNLAMLLVLRADRRRQRAGPRLHLLLRHPDHERRPAEKA